VEPSQPAGDAPCPHCGCLVWFEFARETHGGGSNVGEAKQAIRDWVCHITELSKSELSRRTYFRELVDGLVRCLAARAGAIWLPGEGEWRIAYHIGLEEAGIPEDRLHEPWHDRLLKEVLSSGASSATPPRRVSRQVQEKANPTRSLVLLCPINHGWETGAIVEVFQRAEAGPSTQRGYLRFLEQICEIAGKSRIFCHAKKRPWWKFWGGHGS